MFNLNPKVTDSLASNIAIYNEAELRGKTFKVPSIGLWYLPNSIAYFSSTYGDRQLCYTSELCWLQFTAVDYNTTIAASTPYDLFPSGTIASTYCPIINIHIPIKLYAGSSSPEYNAIFDNGSIHDFCITSSGGISFTSSKALSTRFWIVIPSGQATWLRKG
jgi:hypothetical protein